MAITMNINQQERKEIEAAPPHVHDRLPIREKLEFIIHNPNPPKARHMHPGILRPPTFCTVNTHFPLPHAYISHLHITKCDAIERLKCDAFGDVFSGV